MRAIVEETEALPAAGRVAGVDGLEPRHVRGSRRAGPATIRARSAPRSLMLLDAARHAGALPGRRDRPRRRDGRAARADPRPARRALLARTTRAATRCARRCSGATRPAVGSPTPGVDAVAPARRHRQRATSNANAPIRTRCSTLTRDLIALRREHADLHSGSYATLAAPDGVWAWRRGASIAVVVNLRDADAEIADVDRSGADRRPIAAATASRCRARSRFGRGKASSSSADATASAQHQVEDLGPAAVAG